MMAMAVFAALASACAFALSNSLQHRAASSSASGLGTGGLFMALLRRPSWIVGVALGGTGAALHALALGSGPLIVVQPLVVTGIVLALPLRAALDRSRPSRGDICWAAVTTAGIAVFVVASNPTTTDGDPKVSRIVAMILIGA